MDSWLSPNMSIESNYITTWYNLTIAHMFYFLEKDVHDGFKWLPWSTKPNHWPLGASFNRLVSMFHRLLWGKSPVNCGCTSNMYVPIKSGIDGPRLFPQLSILGTPPGGLFRSAAHELDEASFESVPGLGGIDRGIRGGGSGNGGFASHHRFQY